MLVWPSRGFACQPTGIKVVTPAGPETAWKPAGTPGSPAGGVEVAGAEVAGVEVVGVVGSDGSVGVVTDADPGTPVLLGAGVDPDSAAFASPPPPERTTSNVVPTMAQAVRLAASTITANFLELTPVRD
ncbi:hypothetical protein GCM10009789_66750 [Kribbella sancticallisti]|uniref:Uncharacterized protein n=1 Tax=Kribbella sancticallisti TaxID=460087 RepID=A0ABP4Q7M9_9ACTN